MKTVLFVVTIAICGSAYAQEYRKFKIGFTVGAFNPSLPSAASVEGAYRLNDRMAIGYRAETASLPNNSVNTTGLYYQFYFSRKIFRPFITLGVGQFTPGEMSGGCATPSTNHRINTEKKIGIFPGLGFDLGHLSLIVDANLAAQSKSTLVSTLQAGDVNYHTPYTEYLTNSYVTVKIGFFFGGGKKKAR